MSDGDKNPEVAPARILVIDDEEIIHSSLEKILGRCGHRVTATFDAQEALERLDQDEFDLVITDLMMPKMNGIELLEEIQRRAPALPVLMLTGYPTIRTAIQALRLGAVDYLAKPFTRQELLGPIARALRRSPGARPPAEPAPIPAGGEGIEAPSLALMPGDRLCLREHSWAIYRQDGAMDIGIERSFLDSVHRVSSIEAPHDGDLVEQGYVSLRLTTEGGEVHGVFTPVSGQVIEVNESALEAPAGLDADTWLMRILPTNLEREVALLRRC